MHSNLKRTLKATIICIIVALLITGIVIGAIRLVAGKQIDETISLLKKVSIDINNNEQDTEISLEPEKKRLDSYPEYGTQYATIKIPREDFLNYN